MDGTRIGLGYKKVIDASEDDTNEMSTAAKKKGGTFHPSLSSAAIKISNSRVL